MVYTLGYTRVELRETWAMLHCMRRSDPREFFKIFTVVTHWDLRYPHQPGMARVYDTVQGLRPFRYDMYSDWQLELIPLAHPVALD